MTVWIGTSGWSYDHWTDVLYPRGLASARRLSRFAEEFDTVELNASFYRWPKDSTFAKWREELPDGFRMSVKAHRGLTHYRRLGAPEPWIERFEHCWQLLGDRHGVLLVSCILSKAAMTLAWTAFSPVCPSPFGWRSNCATPPGTIPRCMRCWNAAAPHTS